MITGMIGALAAAIKALIERVVPEKSGVPEDYDRMCRIAAQKARVDFARKRVEMLNDLAMAPEDAQNVLWRRKEKELSKYYKERFEYHLGNQIKLSSFRKG